MVQNEISHIKRNYDFSIDRIDSEQLLNFSKVTPSPTHIWSSFVLQIIYAAILIGHPSFLVIKRLVLSLVSTRRTSYWASTSKSVHTEKSARLTLSVKQPNFPSNSDPLFPCSSLGVYDIHSRGQRIFLSSLVSLLEDNEYIISKFLMMWQLFRMATSPAQTKTSSKKSTMRA